LDGGKTWQPCESIPSPGSAHGHIAVSADGKRWVWSPQRSPVFVTHDQGKSWQQSNGITDNSRVIADKINPQKFYALSLYEGKLYVSNDGGTNFSTQTLNNIKMPQRTALRGDVRGGQDRIYSTPAKEGDLWLAAFDGLYHSKNGGKSFTAMTDVTEIHAFGFGKPAKGSSYSSLYLVGIIKGVRGIFRSDNAAKSWVRINDDQHQWGLILHIAGDPKRWGRVYVGTHGRGIIYGDPN
jgi:photosystem II stability/assembly factor-like uncharacterized protein